MRGRQICYIHIVIYITYLQHIYIYIFLTVRSLPYMSIGSTSLWNEFSFQLCNIQDIMLLHFFLILLFQYNFHNALKIFYNMLNISFNFTILFVYSLKMRMQYCHENNMKVSTLFQFLTYKNKNKTCTTE